MTVGITALQSSRRIPCSSAPENISSSLRSTRRSNSLHCSLDITLHRLPQQILPHVGEGGKGEEATTRKEVRHLVLKYERVGDYISVKVDASAKEIAALALAVQEQQQQKIMIREDAGAKTPEERTELANAIRDVLLDEISKQTQEKYSKDFLGRRIDAFLGESKAKVVLEDLAQVVAKHKLVQSPEICETLFRYMISVTRGWNSV